MNKQKFSTIYGETNKRVEGYYKDAYVTTIRAYKMILEKYNDYKSRNEKAIEYIEKTMRIDDEYPDYMEMEICEYQELLDILKGDKDE